MMTLLAILEILIIPAFAAAHYLKLAPWENYLLYAFLAGAGLMLYYRRQVIQDWRLLRARPGQWLRVLWKEWGEPILVAGILALVIRTYLLGPYKIPTGSMRPTFLEGDRIFVDKISYRFHPPGRGDIIVFKYPLDRKKDYVKRLAGLPGDALEIRDGKLIINGRAMDDAPFSDHYYYNQNDWKYGRTAQIVQVPEGHYFALGDNSAQSSDSRNWGFVPRKNVVGRAFFIWWPPNRIKLAK